MDELNLSLTPSSLHAPSFLFDSPNAVVNAPSFLLPTEYSPYRESVVLPEMPHHVTIFEILLLMPLLVLRRYLTVVLISAWPRRSWRNLRSRHLS